MDHAQRTELFHQIVWPLRAAVLRAARLLIRDPAEAEDLAQETLIKAFNGLESYQERGGQGGGGGAKSWLMAILRHARIDRLRAGARYAAQVSLDAAGLDVADARASRDQGGAAIENPEELLEQLSDARLIHALQQLPEEIRWTLLLVEVHGLSHAEAAEILVVPVGTVKSRAFRGREMLKQGLGEYVRSMKLAGD